MTKIQIIVGTVTGTAQGVADYIKKSLTEKYEVEVNLNAQVSDLLRDKEEFLLFCTSNTGSGDLPDNILPLYNSLVTEYPNIAYRKYALINIGDSNYPTYGQAGHKLDEALKDIGAEAIIEMLTIDSSENRYPQKVALEWLQSTSGLFDN